MLGFAPYVTGEGEKILLLVFNSKWTSTKAYQITQFFQPLARDGYIEVEVHGKKKRILIR